MQEPRDHTIRIIIGDTEILRDELGRFRVGNSTYDTLTEAARAVANLGDRTHLPATDFDSLNHRLAT